MWVCDIVKEFESEMRGESVLEYVDDGVHEENDEESDTVIDVENEREDVPYMDGDKEGDGVKEGSALADAVGVGDNESVGRTLLVGVDDGVIVNDGEGALDHVGETV
jgi:hypothetical protein